MRKENSKRRLLENWRNLKTIEENENIDKWEEIKRGKLLQKGGNKVREVTI